MPKNTDNLIYLSYFSGVEEAGVTWVFYVQLKLGIGSQGTLLMRRYESGVRLEVFSHESADFNQLLQIVAFQRCLLLLNNVVDEYH